MADFGNVFLYVVRLQWPCLFFLKVYLFALLLCLAIIYLLLLSACLSVQQPCKELNGLLLLELKVLNVLRFKIADFPQVGINPELKALFNLRGQFFYTGVLRDILVIHAQLKPLPQLFFGDVVVVLCVDLGEEEIQFFAVLLRDFGGHRRFIIVISVRKYCYFSFLKH
jgi:hypothetical protein